jgi:glycosyltransferase involved in cell wall biosynthesis
MRIAFFSNANSVHLQEWTEYFAARLGHEVLVISLQKPVIPYQGVEVVYAGNLLASGKPGWFTAIPRIRSELRRFRAELLVAYRIVSYGFLASFLGFRPLAMAAQRESLLEKDTPWSRYCVRRAVRCADLINAWSPNIRDSAVRFGASPQRVLTCSRGIDLSLFPTSRERAEAPLRIVMTRSLKRSYNVEQLVRAMPLVLRAEPDAVCEIAGDGPKRAELEALAESLKVSASVRFVGRRSRDGILDLLRGAHVYVSTSVTDGLALSHFEAMAAGVFPVVSDISANRLWIRDRANGFLVPLGEAETLAAKILQAWRDPGLRGRAAAENRALVEREFDRSKNLLRISRAYEALAAGRARG